MRKYFFIGLLLLAGNPPANSNEVGQTPPPCSAIENNGTVVNFDTYKGKVLLIDFWATWCPPCKKSMPFLNNLRNQRLKDGFEILAINVDENSEDAKSFLKENPVDYKIAYDPNGDCPQKFAVKAMPSSYLVDKAGKIRLIHLGFRDEDEAKIQDQVSNLLAE